MPSTRAASEAWLSSTRRDRSAGGSEDLDAAPSCTASTSETMAVPKRACLSLPSATATCHAAPRKRGGPVRASIAASRHSGNAAASSAASSAANRGSRPAGKRESTEAAAPPPSAAKIDAESYNKLLTSARETSTRRTVSSSPSDRAATLRLARVSLAGPDRPRNIAEKNAVSAARDGARSSSSRDSLSCNDMILLDMRANADKERNLLRMNVYEQNSNANARSIP